MPEAIWQEFTDALESGGTDPVRTLGRMLNVIDQLTENGIVSRVEIQNARIKARVKFNESLRSLRS